LRGRLWGKEGGESDVPTNLKKGRLKILNINKKTDNTYDERLGKGVSSRSYPGGFAAD